MLSKTIALALTLSVVVLGAPSGGSPVSNSEPTLEVVFPQDAEATHFIDSWGHGRSSGRRHQGTDLMAAKMTEVYAVADGVVSGVRESRLAGRYLTIDHAGGWSSRYMHLNNDIPGTNNGRAPWSLTVASGLDVGSDVVAGQLIGWVGDSGNAERGNPHTHFELHKDGKAVNPYPYLLVAHYKALNELIAQQVAAELDRVAGLPGHAADLFYIA